MNSWLRDAADVFALASIPRNEAFGITQLEAMGCGKPVVNTSLDSGVPSVSLDGVTGLTVPPCDSLALAGALNKLLDDAGLRDTYGRAARARVNCEFDQNVMLERMVQLYSEVLRVPFNAEDTNLAQLSAGKKSSPELSGSGVPVSAQKSDVIGKSLIPILRSPLLDRASIFQIELK